MKYTNLIINGDIVKVDQLISDNKILKPITILVSLPVAIVGLSILTSAVPAALIIDGTRYVKYRYNMYMKNYKRYRYYDRVFTSLGYSHQQKSKMLLAFETLPDRFRQKTNTKYILRKGSYHLVYIRENIQKDFYNLANRFK